MQVKKLKGESNFQVTISSTNNSKESHLHGLHGVLFSSNKQGFDA